MGSPSLEFIFDKKISVARRLDHLYDALDDWMLDGEWEKCDEFLQLLLDEYSSVQENLDMLLGAVTVTHPGQHKFENRQRLIEHIYKEVKEWRGEDYAKRLMVGFI